MELLERQVSGISRVDARAGYWWLPEVGVVGKDFARADIDPASIAT